jgi:hypothetical protein
MANNGVIINQFVITNLIDIMMHGQRNIKKWGYKHRSFVIKNLVTPGKIQRPLNMVVLNYEIQCSKPQCFDRLLWNASLIYIKVELNLINFAVFSLDGSVNETYVHRTTGGFKT